MNPKVDALLCGMERGGLLAWRIGGPLSMLALVTLVPPRPAVVLAFVVLLIGTVTAFTMRLPKLSIRYNAARFPGATKEERITRAIVAAKSDGVTTVFVPKSMLPYDVNLVTFNTLVVVRNEQDGA